MPEFEALWSGGPLFAQAEHFRLSTDSILLADFADRCKAKKAVDLGSASGILPLLLLTADAARTVTGIEILPEAAALAEENLARNGLSERGTILCDDLRRYRMLLPAGAFDLVTVNPPYYPARSGHASENAGRAAARTELACTLRDVCAAASWLLRTGGSFCMVHKPERLSEIFCCMTAVGLEPKRLRTVHARAGRAPSLVLVEGRRGGHPGLCFEAPLLLQKEDGTETEELRRIYHRL